MTMIDKAEALRVAQEASDNSDSPQDVVAAIAAIEPQPVPDAQPLIAAAVAKERDELISQHAVMMMERDAAQYESGDLYHTLAAAQAREAKLREAGNALERAASEVSRRGAETGPQWSKLTIALLKYRAALIAKEDKP